MCVLRTCSVATFNGTSIALNMRRIPVWVVAETVNAVKGKTVHLVRRIASVMTVPIVWQACALEFVEMGSVRWERTVPLAPLIVGHARGLAALQMEHPGVILFW